MILCYMEHTTVSLQEYLSVLQERDALRKQVAQQQLQIAEQQQKIESLINQVTVLQEQLSGLQKMLFGQKSEKSKPQTDPNAPKISVAAHDRKKRIADGKDTIEVPESCPVEQIIIDLDESEKIDPKTGEVWVKIGEDTTRILAYVPAYIKIKEFVVAKYAHPTNPDAGIRTGPLPERLLPRCMADESLLADILVKKFCDHIPYYRQSEMLARTGVKISRQTLCDWGVRAGMALKPIYDAMKMRILESENVFIDETPVQMLSPGKGKTQKGYMWILCGGNERDPPYRLYDFYTNRKHENVNSLLGEYTGVFHSDKYEAYEKLAKQKGVVWCPCWVHIRRHFIEAETGDPVFRNWILRKIRYLFLFEKIAWNRTPEERLRIRQEKEAPIIDEIIQKIEEARGSKGILPKSKLGQALNYFHDLIPYVKNYLYYPFARMDNNVAERAARPLALGRKNWLFFGNEDGGEMASIVYSLVQTCLGLGINPAEYLEDVMRRLMSYNQQRVYELIPDEWLRRRQISHT